jgi:predicted secreted protein
MATYTGQTGVFKISNAAGNAVAAVAEVTSFTIDHTVNTIEDTAMGDQYRTYRTGVNEWTGSADVFFEDSLITTFGSVLVGNNAGAAGATGNVVCQIEAFPGGDVAGHPKLSGNVVVTGFSVASEMEGMVTATISFQGTGALAIAAAS